MNNDSTGKIAVYTRVSTDEQAEQGYSLRAQKRSVESYIELYKDELKEDIIYYEDDGYSAKSLNRKELQRMLMDIERGVVTKVIIHNLDRLTRNIKDLMILFEFFETNNTKLYSLREKIDTDSASGRFFVSMIVLISQWERETISERTIRGVDQAAREGIYVYGRPPFGYDLENKRLQVVPLEAELVNKIYHMFYYEGRSIGYLVHYFASNHNNVSGVWNHTKIRSILGNEIYTGTFKNKRLKVENHSPAIIDKDLFYQVQLLLQSRNRFNSLTYIFGRRCFNSNSNENLVLDCSIHPGKIYYYYLDPVTKERINEVDIDEQITAHINAHYIQLVNTIIKKRIVSHSKQVSRNQVIEELYHKGVVSKDYYLEKVNMTGIKSEKLVSYISDLKSNIQDWGEMTREEKIKTSKYLIKSITIDMRNKEVKGITFY